MGSVCSRQHTVDPSSAPSTVAVLFRRIDKDRKGYICLDDLKALMKDDLKAYFPEGRGAEQIMTKYGVDGKLTQEQFEVWWNSTYTTYGNDDALSKLVDEALEDDASDHNVVAGGQSVPSNANVAVSRS